MRNLALITTAVLATLAFAGCAGNSDDGRQGNPPTAGQTYVVNVMKAHALQEKTRTIKVDLLQGGSVVGSGSFTFSGSDPETPVLLFTKTVGPGDVQVKAYEGVNPVGVKTMTPSKCPKPLEFEAHVVDDAVHLYTNCD